jgi:hypothetical protein
MASIGIIVRASQSVEALAGDWVPVPLGARADVVAAIEKCLPEDRDTLALRLRVEEPTENDDPRTISVSGIWGPRECEVLRMLCRKLDARFYDAEASDFIEL